MGALINGEERWKAPTGRESFIRLDLNEGYWNRHIENVVSSSLDVRMFTQYPEYDNLLEALSEYTKISVNNIAVTNGADQAIQLIAQMFGKDRRFLLPSPVFSFYKHCLALEGADIVAVPYDKLEEGFEFPTDRLLASVKPGDIIILCTPNNPLGCEISEGDLNKICVAVKAMGGEVIIDISYSEFGSSCIRPISHKDVIFISTFSKTFSMAGLRLGYILANRTIINDVLCLRGPWDVNAASVQVGTILLDLIPEFRKKISVDLNTKRKLEKSATLGGIKVINTHTNFMLFKVNSANDFQHYMRKRNVLVTPIENYVDSHELLDGFVRVGVPSPENYNHVEAALIEYGED